MNIFKRLFKVGQAEAHNVVDKLEDPIKMSEQAIRDLKKDLATAMQSFAEVKAIAIRMERDKNTYSLQAQDWERKAVLLLEKAQSGQMTVDQAEKLAREALVQKDDCLKKATEAEVNHQKQTEMVDKLAIQIDKLKKTVQQQENDLITLKARAKTASSMKKINKQLSSIDSSSTLNMLERMKQKVDEDETLAQAYAELEGINTNLDQQINQALNESDTKGDQLLQELKAKMLNK